MLALYPIFDGFLEVSKFDWFTKDVAEWTLSKPVSWISWRLLQREEIGHLAIKRTPVGLLSIYEFRTLLYRRTVVVVIFIHDTHSSRILAVRANLRPERRTHSHQLASSLIFLGLFKYLAFFLDDFIEIVNRTHDCSVHRAAITVELNLQSLLKLRIDYHTHRWLKDCLLPLQRSFLPLSNCAIAQTWKRKHPRSNWILILHLLAYSVFGLEVIQIIESHGLAQLPDLGKRDRLKV